MSHVNEDERPRSPLVNALWGGGIPLPQVSPAQRRRQNQALIVIVLVVATAMGVLSGLLGSWVEGLITSAVTAAVVGLGFIWASRADRPPQSKSE